MKATRDATRDGSGSAKHALEAGEAAAAEVEKRMKNPLRQLDFFSRVRAHLMHASVCFTRLLLH